MSKLKTNGRGRLTKRLLASLKVGIFGLLLVLPVLVHQQAKVEGAPSSTINFQARLLSNSGAIVADGTYNIEFKLYNASSSSGSSQGSCTGDANCLWTETRTGGSKVSVKNGYLSVYLGSVTSFPTTINWNEEHWLTLNVGGTGTPGWDNEMTPRIKLTAVPFAFQAEQLAKTSGSNRGSLGFSTVANNPAIVLPDASGTVCLQSSSSCGFATGSGDADYIQNGTSTQSNANFNISASSGVAATVQGASGQNILVLNQNGGAAALTISSTGSATLAGNLVVQGVGASSFAGSVTVSGVLSAPGGGTSSERFGAGIGTLGNDSLAVGNSADASGLRAVALGRQSVASGADSVVIGYQATNTAFANTVVVGASAQATQNNSVAIGSSALSRQHGIAIGQSATNGASSGTSSIAIGSGASNNTFAASMALGRGATNTANNQLVIGGDGFQISNAYLGNGVTNATPLGFTLQATGGSGTNIAGASTTIAGGKGTGNAAGGSIVFQTSTAGASGTTLQSLSTRLTIGTANITSTLPILGSNGEDFAPSFAFANDSDTGFFLTGTNEIGVSSAGTQIVTFGGPQASIKLESESTLEIYSAGTDNLEIASSESTAIRLDEDDDDTTERFDILTNGGASTLFSVLQNGNTSVAGTLTATGLTTLNGGLTVEAGDTFTFNGDAFTDLTGTGLQVSSGALQSTLGVSVDLTAEVTGILPIANGGTNASTAQGAINNISGLTTNGDLLYHNGTNSIRLARGANGECLTSNATTILWGSCGSGSGVTTVGTFSGSSQTNGANITGTTITFGPADTTNPGMVSTGSQTFAGAKTFNGAITAAAAGTALSVTNDASIGGNLTVTGNIQGGTTQGDTLSLRGSNQAWSSTTTNEVEIQNSSLVFNGQTSVADGQFPALISFNDTVSLSGADVWALYGFNYAPTFQQDTSFGFGGSPAFAASPTMQPTVGGINDSSLFVLSGFQANLNHKLNHSGSAGTSALIMGYTDNPFFGRAGGTGTHTVTDYAAFGSWIGRAFDDHVMAGYTLTNARSFWAQNPEVSGGGVVTNNIGLDVAALTSGSTSNIGVRIAEPTGTGGIALSLTGTSGNTSSGILFGGDTNLYRSSATTLTNSGDFSVNGGDLLTNQTTFNLLNTTATTVNAFGAATALTLGASGGTTITPGGNLTFAESNTKGITLQSDLSGGARSTDVLTISQANNATNNSTGNLLELNNADTGSTAAVLQVTQAATGTAITATSATGGTGLTVTGVTTGTAVNANTLTSGTGMTATAITSGTGLALSGSALTSATAVSLSLTNNAATSPKAVNVTGAASAITADFTGAYLNVAPTRTLTAAATRTDSGNFLNLTRANTVNNASGTYNITGALANLQSNCTQTAGTCADSSNILSINQQYANATGSVLFVQGAGTGNLVQVRDTTGGGTDVFTIADGGNAVHSANLNINGNTTLGDASGDTVVYNAGTVTVNNTLNFDSNTFVITPSSDAIGIGTTSTTHTLGNSSTVNNVMTIQTTNSKDEIVGIGDNDFNIAADGGMYLTYDGNDNSGSSEFAIYTGSASGVSEMFQIDNTGNGRIAGTFRPGSYGAATATTVCRDGTGILSACSSNRAYKDNIQDLSMGLETINQLTPRQFSWKSDGSADFGFVAEEVAEVNPLLGQYESDGRLSGVRYMQMSALLTRGVQELSVRTSNNTARINAVQASNGTQDGSIAGLTNQAAALNGAISGLNTQVATLQNQVNSGAFANLNVSGLSVFEGLKVTGMATARHLVITDTATIKDLTVQGRADFGGDIRLRAKVNTRQAVTKTFKASKPIPAGSVVVLDPDREGYVTTTATSGDTKIVGVAVEEAATTDREIEVAIGGSVQIRVDSPNVSSGELLVSSQNIGTAETKASPVTGSVLGKATSHKDGNGLAWALILLN